jgi:hypothetical protein
MPRTRKNHPPSLKAKVAAEAISAHKTVAEIEQMFGVHPTPGSLTGHGFEPLARSGDSDDQDEIRERQRPLRRRTSTTCYCPSFE